ncbi:HAMP domain-containing histidine kinase, partial [bacterium]
VITERFEHFKKSAIDGGLRLALSANAPLTVYGDPVRLGQLVFNLLDNAFKYTPRGGLIELSSEKDSDFAVIKVKDTGIGISQDDLPYIFDRFFRVDKVRGRDDGTSGAVSAGLGLSICSEIVRSLNGTITAASEYGNGTVFTVRLPLESSEGNDKRAN